MNSVEQATPLSSAMGWRRLVPLAIFLGTLFVYGIFVISLGKPEDRNQNSDYDAFYGPVAAHILAGQGITDNSGRLSTLYPPGFPALLAGIFWLSDVAHVDRLSGVAVFNCLCMATCSILIFSIAKAVFSFRIACIAALFWSFYPFHLWLAKQPNSEVPFLIFFVAAEWLWLRRMPVTLSTSAICGALLAAASLTRPIGMFLPVLFVATLLVAKQRISWSRFLMRAALLAIGFLVVVAPWESLIYSRTNKIVPLSTNGPYSTIDGLTFALHAGPNGERVAVPASVLSVMQAVDQNQRSMRSMSTIFAFLLREFRKNPVGVIELFGIKILRSWYGTNAKWHEVQTAIVQIFVLSVGLVGVVLSWRGDRLAWFFGVVTLSVVVYFWAMTVLVLSILRYMIPAMSLIIVSGAVATDAAISCVSTSRLGGGQASAAVQG
jgi:4-amino-4-deoxy-L-arabinose transferase-like glycosyltransferase